MFVIPFVCASQEDTNLCLTTSGGKATKGQKGVQESHNQPRNCYVDAAMAQRKVSYKNPQNLYHIQLRPPTLAQRKKKIQ
jgi:hypothetical protein